MRELTFKVGHVEIVARQTGNSFGDQVLDISGFDGENLIFFINESFEEGCWISFCEKEIKRILDNQYPKLF